LTELILASASPRRQELLRQIGLPFRTVVSNVDEAAIVSKDYSTPAEFAKALAYAKAKDVAKQIAQGIVIGADTIVVLNGKILGKPENSAAAREMLLDLQGKTHEVITGLALIKRPSDQSIVECATTHVKFGAVSEQEIDAYLSTGEPFDKAGAYGIQGRAAVFIEGIEGCYSNVVGLPLFLLSKLLQQFGFSRITA